MSPGLSAAIVTIVEICRLCWWHLTSLWEEKPYINTTSCLSYVVAFAVFEVCIWAVMVMCLWEGSFFLFLLPLWHHQHHCLCCSVHHREGMDCSSPVTSPRLLWTLLVCHWEVLWLMSLSFLLEYHQSFQGCVCWMPLGYTFLSSDNNTVPYIQHIRESEVDLELKSKFHGEVGLIICINLEINIGREMLNTDTTRKSETKFGSLAM